MMLLLFRPVAAESTAAAASALAAAAFWRDECKSMKVAYMCTRYSTTSPSSKNIFSEGDAGAEGGL
jgi:hypothetical protein